MESYEEFCLRSAAALRDMERTCEPLWAPRARSVIRFYGRAVLSPLVRKTRTPWAAQATANGCFKTW
uniref:Uncharacterized protein n=1 Tax=Mola mola TaxID=94237 RepID=A0A3Q3WT17_MOLML